MNNLKIVDGLDGRDYKVYELSVLHPTVESMCYMLDALKNTLTEQKLKVKSECQESNKIETVFMRRLPTFEYDEATDTLKVSMRIAKVLDRN